MANCLIIKLFKLKIMIRKILNLFVVLILLIVMTDQSFAKDKPSENPKYQKAILAGGCFWGMQELFRLQPGVIETKVGYTGGVIPNPTYKIVTSGLTNHAESIEITFDPVRTSYEKLLKFFFTMHDPTTIDRQQNDVGSQYRSAIFYLNDEQKKIAENVIEQGNKSGVFKKPIATKLEKAGKFYEAEEEHQDYLEKYPSGYTCHFIRNEWKF